MNKEISSLFFKKKKRREEGRKKTKRCLSTKRAGLLPFGQKAISLVPRGAHAQRAPRTLCLIATSMSHEERKLKNFVDGCARSFCISTTGPTVLFPENKPGTTNQPAVLFSLRTNQHPPSAKRTGRK
jgi:hypothetical protein